MIGAEGGRSEGSLVGEDDEGMARSLAIPLAMLHLEGMLPAWQRGNFDNGFRLQENAIYKIS